MLEVEVKVRGSREEVRSRLTERGAEPLGTVRQRDTYYDAPHRDFAETDEALRLRRERRLDDADGAGRGAGECEGEETRVTYKGPLVEAASKTRTEYETGVDDGETMDAILRELGFSSAAVVEKERDRFAVGEYTVTLDDVTDVGEFVEVERAASEEDLESVREGAYDVLRSLDLDPSEQIRTSYLGMLLGDAPQ